MTATLQAATPDQPIREPASKVRGMGISQRNQERIVSLLAPVALLLVWEAVVRIGLMDHRFFPAPSSIVETFYYLLFQVSWDDSLVHQVLISLGRVAIGFVIGAIPAVLLGIIMGLVPLVRAAIQPLIGAILPIPKVAILPIIMLIFGIGEESKWVIIAIGVFFQVLVATATGVSNIDKIYFDVGRNFKAGRLATYRKIALPGALPTIFAGLRLGWGMALLLLVTAEMVSSDGGIGFLIWKAWQTLSVEEMYVGLVTIAAVGILSFWLFDFMERKFLPWRNRF
ncbi:MAG TPA: ABC transporter permease [Stellaceae bacterium]|nr:ABC transporter permease [Stellaceae bacterium]